MRARALSIDATPIAPACALWQTSVLAFLWCCIADALACVWCGLVGGEHGSCQAGQCICDAGWAGDRCTRPPARRPLWEMEAPPSPPTFAAPLTPDQLALLERRSLELHGPQGAAGMAGQDAAAAAASGGGSDFDRFRQAHWAHMRRPSRRTEL